MANKKGIPQLPHSPGVYLMRDRTGLIVYIGKARDLKKRVASYFSKTNSQTAKIQSLLHVLRHVDYVSTKSEREALVLERRLIHRYQPMFNTMWKDDKSYPFVALTMGEDYPRIFLTRSKKQGKGTLYFGPYPNAGRVRQLLRWAWRKQLFPLRPCKLKIEEGKPYPYEKVRSCLYLHTGQCSAPCVGKIKSSTYKKIANQAKWFFEGKTDRMATRLEKEMNRLSKKQEYEEAGKLRDRLKAIDHIMEPITYRELTESGLRSRVRDSQGGSRSNERTPFKAATRNRGVF